MLIFFPILLLGLLTSGAIDARRITGKITGNGPFVCTLQNGGSFDAWKRYTDPKVLEVKIKGHPGYGWEAEFANDPVHGKSFRTLAKTSRGVEEWIYGHELNQWYIKHGYLTYYLRIQDAGHVIEVVDAQSGISVAHIAATSKPMMLAQPVPYPTIPSSYAFDYDDQYFPNSQIIMSFCFLDAYNMLSLVQPPALPPVSVSPSLTRPTTSESSFRYGPASSASPVLPAPDHLYDLEFEKHQHDTEVAHIPENVKSHIVSTQSVSPTRLSYRAASSLSNPMPPNVLSKQHAELFPVRRPTFQPFPTILSRPRGLRNLGNTCFLNAVVQCLAQTTLLREKFENFPIQSPMAKELRSSFTRMAAIGDDELDLTPLIAAIGAQYPEYQRVPGKSDYEQQDAHELLRHLLGSFQAEYESDNSDSNVIDHIFGGQFLKVRQCKGCSKVTFKVEQFLDVSLPISSNSFFEQNEASQKSPTRLTPIKIEGELMPSQSATVASCIASFLIVEEQKDVECEQCDAKELSRRISLGHRLSDQSQIVRESALTHYRLLQPPRVLVFHLKRFKRDSRGNFQKASDAVRFDEILDLTNGLAPSNVYAKMKMESPSSAKYRLYGIIEHEGNSPSHGHYFAYVSPSLGNWFLCNDGSVTRTEWEKVSQAQAYIMFYERI